LKFIPAQAIRGIIVAVVAIALCGSSCAQEHQQEEIRTSIKKGLEEHCKDHPDPRDPLCAKPKG
jgi:hypothetical protein